MEGKSQPSPPTGRLGETAPITKKELKPRDCKPGGEEGSDFLSWANDKKENP